MAKKKKELKSWEFPESTNILKIEYDKEKETMYTTYQNGKRYKYKGVSKDIIKQITKADSVGSMHHKLIIAAGFEGKPMF